MHAIAVAGSNDVSIQQLAKRLNQHDSQTYRLARSAWFKKLGIKFRTLKNPKSGKTGWHMTQDECERIVAEYVARREHKVPAKNGLLASIAPAPRIVTHRGKMMTFYVCDSGQMHDGEPLIKLGITEDPGRRLDEHQTHWPSAKFIRTWPTKSTWDQCAMDCIGRAGKHVKGELWTGAIEAFVTVGDQFFTLMGTVETPAGRT